MNTMVKVIVAIGFVAVAAAVAIILPPGARGSAAEGYPPKDQSRLPAGIVSGDAADYAGNLLQLAKAVKSRPADTFAPGNMVLADAGGPPAGFGPPPAGPRDGQDRGRDRGQDRGEASRRLVRMGPPRMAPVPPDRRACNEQIDRGAGAAGYLKSKLGLDSAQKDAWLKIEQAADPVVQKMRAFCAELPTEPGAPSFPTMIELADKQIALRSEFVHAIVAPAKAFYDLLTPQQRAVLDRPPPPIL
ncbi:MAG: hypothetical protein GC182_12075 [Rhodopseudomonas sp.]|nr:hypothetical protein [Rhodopseudomonas sp.]